MLSFSIAKLSDAAVLQGMKSLRVRERSATALLVAYIAEAEERRLYLPQACDSMVTFCERELGLSEDEALKRIHAGRAARRFPEIFGMLADGRLSMSAVNVLAPHLTKANADDLLAAASRRSKPEIQRLLAARFPKPEPLPLVLAPQVAPERLAAGPAHAVTPECVAPDSRPTSAPAPSPAPERPNVHARVRPHATDRYTAQLAWNQATEDELRECESLLGHRIPAGRRGEVIAYAIHQLVIALRKRKFGATNRPATRPRPSTRPRHIPAHVRRAVHERDGNRCTFVSESGQRCESTCRLEYDHVVPIARGGRSTVDNLRLRCQAHNQFEAERTFGAAFMQGKRAEARARAAMPDGEARSTAGIVAAAS